MSWPVIVFLDVDGVLNGHQFLVEAKSCKIDPECVRRLNRLLRETDARIVLSSAWRYMVHGHAMTLGGFQYLLRTHGMIGSLNGCDNLIIDLTCRDEDLADRPDQIRAWLESHPSADRRYVVLDDGDFVWRDMAVVRTDGSVGLTDADVDRAIALLADPDEPRKPECCGHGRGGTGRCCDRAGEYNGFASDGPLLFRCPNGCSCHD